VECCEDVLSDVYAETVTTNTPGLELFRMTLRELVQHAKATDDE
jgi:hypothetical protein